MEKPYIDMRIKYQDASMHKAEEIWQNLITAMIKEDTDMFQPKHWSWLKKTLYPMTHERVRDFIPQIISVDTAYKYGYKHGYGDASEQKDFDDTNHSQRVLNSPLIGAEVIRN